MVCESMKQDTTNPIGLAMAGHWARDAKNEKAASEYDNPLTDLVNMIIAETKAKNNTEKGEKA